MGWNSANLCFDMASRSRHKEKWPLWENLLSKIKQKKTNTFKMSGIPLEVWWDVGTTWPWEIDKPVWASPLLLVYFLFFPRSLPSQFPSLFSFGFLSLSSVFLPFSSAFFPFLV